MAKILLVEDSKIQRMATRSYLENNGHELDELENYDQTVGCLEGKSYQLFLLDLVTPGHRSVVDFVKEIISKGIKTPVLVLSGKIKPDIKHELEGLGVKEFLWKPVTENILNQKVSDMIS